jgi:hypothetical protein
MPGGHVCSASFKGVADNALIRTVGLGQEKIGRLFSKGQSAFYSGHAPEGLGLDDLSVLGPIQTLRLKTEPEGLGRKLVGELWLYPDGSQIVELSTRALPSEAFRPRPRLGPFYPAAGSIWRASSRPRPRPRSSSSRRTRSPGRRFGVSLPPPRSCLCLPAQQPATPLLLDRARGRHGQRCGAGTTTTLRVAPSRGRRQRQHRFGAAAAMSASDPAAPTSRIRKR